MGRVTRACNGCRVRKVRCNGEQPCSQCSNLKLTCNFAPPPGKRKPGVRGRLVAQLRDNPNASNGRPESPGNNGDAMRQEGARYKTVSSASPVMATAASSVTSPDYASQSSHTSPSLFESFPGPDPAGYTLDFFYNLLPVFEQHVYPVNPVIPPEEIRASIANMHADFQDNALVYAFGAVTINLTQTSGDIASQMTYLMRNSLKAHRQAEFGGDWSSGEPTEIPATVKRIMTCIFLEISLMSFKLFDRAMTLLREAISMIQILHIEQYSVYDGTMEPSQVTRRQRLYWEAYIHERFLATVANYPCILTPLKTGLPFVDSTIPAQVDRGFNRLIQLFIIMDAPFLAYWCALEDPSKPTPEMTAQWIENKQAQLDQDEAGAAEADRDLGANGQGAFSEIQHADLFVTRLWLRTLVWQLALSRGFLRSAPPQNTHEGLSLHFPAQRLSSQLRKLVSRLDSVASIAIHGSGILQKLFEITSTVADVLALPLGQGQSQEDAATRLEDFVFLVRFLFSFERIQKEQRDYLRDKLDVLQEVYTIVDFAGIASESPDS